MSKQLMIACSIILTTATVVVAAASASAVTASWFLSAAVEESSAGQLVQQWVPQAAEAVASSKIFCRQLREGRDRVHRELPIGGVRDGGGSEARGGWGAAAVDAADDVGEIAALVSASGTVHPLPEEVTHDYADDCKATMK